MVRERSANALAHARRIHRQAPTDGMAAAIPVEHPQVGDRHVYKFSNGAEWADTIEHIRAAFAVRRAGAHLEIECKCETGQDIVLHFKMQDAYLIGFTLNRDAYEFGKFGDRRPHKIPGSHRLGYDPGYGDMGAANTMEDIKIGYWSFYQALKEMIRGTGLVGERRQKWLADIRPLIPTVLVTLPECVRFKWHFLAVKPMMLEEDNQGDPHKVKDWMEAGIKNWEKLSIVAFEKNFTDHRNPPPAGNDYPYSKIHMDTAFIDYAWAEDLVVVRCLLERKPRNVLQRRRLNGKQEVFVFWNNKEKNWQPIIRMRREFPSFDIRVTIPAPPPPPPPRAPAPKIRMKRDFPSFDTGVNPPAPLPQAPAPKIWMKRDFPSFGTGTTNTRGHLTQDEHVIGSCSSDKQIYLGEI